jgi:hypothetical protein
MVKRAVPGFLPSTSGLHFNNSFARVPLRSIGIPEVVAVPIGGASDGLCGGMAFAARDYFEAGRPAACRYRTAEFGTALRLSRRAALRPGEGEVAEPAGCENDERPSSTEASTEKDEPPCWLTRERLRSPSPSV